jgi:Flp pilus assembly protein TadG
MIRKWLRRGARGATAVEFAIVGWMLCIVTFALIEVGVMWWLKSGMQLTASMTARCGAMGYTYNTSNFLCTNTSTTQNYAVNYALGNLGNNGNVVWLVANMIITNSVTVYGPVTNSTYCHNAVGNYFAVSISSSFFANWPPPLGNIASLSASACYPMP